MVDTDKIVSRVSDAGLFFSRVRLRWQGLLLGARVGCGLRDNVKRATKGDGGHVIKCQNQVDDCSKKNESSKFSGQVYP